jgi:hypothetical protein
VIDLETKNVIADGKMQYVESVTYLIAVFTHSDTGAPLEVIMGP